MKKVLIVMGSGSDFDQMKPAWMILKSLGIEFDAVVASAHRTPDRVTEIASSARRDGFRVIIAGAGGAAHLAGVIASHTTLPVIAVPLVSGSLGGMDALLSSVQMPGGVPIASVGIGGAKNAGLFAAAIIGSTEQEIEQKLVRFRSDQENAVLEANRYLKSHIQS